VEAVCEREQRRTHDDHRASDERITALDAVALLRVGLAGPSANACSCDDHHPTRLSSQ
jgi:hypothetical protein